MGVEMTEEGDGAKERRTPLLELLAGLLDALKDALLALRPQTLFVTDIEMIRRIGVPEKIARAAIRVLDENPHSGFPKKSELWGNRRYWPAVEVWFQQQQDLDMSRPDSKRLYLR
jgi:hypothetical protein